MKTVIVGGGKGCLAFLEFLGARQLRELDIEVVCVVDVRVDAPGLVFASQQGIQTMADYRVALSLPNVELILELTGDKQVLTDLYNEIHHGVRIIDHDSARVFWDLIRLERSLRDELQNRTILENQFRQFIDSASDIIAIKDVKGRYVVVNPATASLFGMEPSQLIGRTPAELYDAEVAGIISSHDDEVIKGRQHGRYTERFVIDDDEYYLDVTRFPLLDYQGEVDGVCVIGREVTQRFFPLIFDSISHAIFTTDAGGTITSFNRAAEEITGYRRDEVIGRDCSAIFRSDRCETTCPLKTSIHTGERAQNEEATIITRSGQPLPISISTAALVEDGVGIVGGVEMFRDLRLVTELRKQVEKSYVFEDIVSKSHLMKRLFETLPLIAGSQSTVLIEGESGTGKELIARAIHNLGPRRDGPFVAINCAAVPDTLIESELFGYKKGAFTDAKEDKPGRFTLAEGGTLLLDEIGDLSKQMQVKLLRVLQERQYEPLGSTETVKADVRVIASTNRNLAQDVTNRKFRQDLYYRLNVVRLELPPLRTRNEDIPLLIQHFIDRFNTLQGRRITGCSERVLSALMRYPFPGNIRELENAIEHAFVVCIDTTIQMDDLPQHILGYLADQGEKTPAVKPPLEDAEMHAIVSCLERNEYNRTRTAAELGISRNTLWRKMKRYGIATGSS